MDTLEQTAMNEAQVEETTTEAVVDTENAEQTESTETIEEVPAVEEETNKEEEPQTPEAEPQATEADEPQAPEAPQIPLMKTKEEVLARAQEIAEQGDGGQKQELELLKQLYYKYHRADLMAHQQAFVEAGGDPESYQPEEDPTEEPFRQAMQQIRQRRAQLQAELEQQRAENLQKKLSVIEKIKLLATTPEEAGKSYEAFKQLQEEWRQTGPVPAEQVAEVWKNYQYNVEQFYDMLKLNIQFREYDFRKNLEAKNLLIQQAERLAQEPDVVKAINQLQTLHQEWKEIGPVAKDLREDIWNRFKEASTVVRKRHQEYFEARKAQEEENLARKTQLCEQAEAISTEGLQTFAQWDAKTQEILQLQQQWRTIGYASQRENNTIFERFRQACDRFFAQKADHFKALKEQHSQNIQKKRDLIQQAEALQDSTDWRQTADALIKLQQEWKAIGATPHKQGEELWNRFRQACDHFFEARSQATAGERAQEKENLEKKHTIIDQLKALAESTEAIADNAAEQVRQLQQQWNAVGFVPIREKDKLHRQYREVVDQLYKKFNLSRAERRLNSFKATLRVAAEAGASNLLHERDRLARAYDIMKSELQTYQNNIGFLTASSKKGNSLVEEIQKKADKLSDELQLLREKIKAVEAQMRQQQEE